MIASLFRTDRPQGFVVLPFLVVAITGPLGLRDWAPPAGGHMPLYELLVKFMALHRLMPVVLSGLVVYWVAIQASALANDVELFSRRTRMPLLLVPVTLGLWPGGVVLDPVLAGLPFALQAMRAVWWRTERAKSLAPRFEAGWWVGVAALFHVQYAFLLVAVWTSTAVLHPFSWRSYLIPVLGAALPIYFSWGLHRLGGSSWHPLSTLLTGIPRWPFPSALYVILGIALLSLLVLGALVAFAAGYQRANVRGKNIRAAFLGMFLVFLVMAALGGWFSGELAPAWIGVPLGLFLSYFFQNTGYAPLKEAAAWTLLVMALWCQWAGAAIFAA